MYGGQGKEYGNTTGCGWKGREMRNGSGKKQGLEKELSRRQGGGGQLTP